MFLVEKPFDKATPALLADNIRFAGRNKLLLPGESSRERIRPEWSVLASLGKAKYSLLFFLPPPCPALKTRFEPPGEKFLRTRTLFRMQLVHRENKEYIHLCVCGCVGTLKCVRLC